MDNPIIDQNTPDIYRQKMADLAWNYLVQLRVEIINLQNLRAKFLISKTLFVSASCGAMAAYAKDIGSSWLVVPAFASFCFDLIIESYTLSIKRIGKYIREVLEKILRDYRSWAKENPLYEEYLTERETPNIPKHLGNWLLTLLAFWVAIVGVLLDTKPMPHHLLRPSLLTILTFLLTIDIKYYLKVRHTLKRGTQGGNNPSVPHQTRNPAPPQ